LVRHELGISVDAPIASFVESLRNGNGGVTVDVVKDEGVASAITLPLEDVSSSASTPPPLRERRMRIVFAVTGIVGFLTAISSLYRMPVRPEPSTRPRVAVAVFENRTGDSASDMVGIAIADYTRYALHHTGLLDVDAPAFDFWQLQNARPANR